MPEQKAKASLMTVLGVLFTIIALLALIAILRLKSLADTAEQQADTGNSAPAVDSLSAIDENTVDILTNNLTPIEANANTVTISGNVSDPNGCTDINEVIVWMYRTGVAGPPAAACAADNNDCYIATIPAASLTSCDGAGDLVAHYSTAFDTTNYIDPTDAGSPDAGVEWNVSVTVNDVGAMTDNMSDTFEVNSLAAFSIEPLLINYGTVALGAVSNQQNVDFTNTGNRDVDTLVKANANMTSNLPGYSAIAATAVHYSLTDGFAYAAGAAVTLADVTFAIQLPQQTNDLAPTTTSTHWLLTMPSEGVNGTYTNILTFTAQTY